MTLDVTLRMVPSVHGEILLMMNLIGPSGRDKPLPTAPDHMLIIQHTTTVGNTCISRLALPGKKVRFDAKYMWNCREKIHYRENLTFDHLCLLVLLSETTINSSLQ